MKIISVPGKIFFAGEYGALRGFPTLSVAVKPDFIYTSGPSLTEIHPQSPAGKLPGSQNLPGILTDPYSSTGGMGRSTAEFLVKSLQTQTSLSKQAQDSDELAQTLWHSYREVTATEPNPPSGVDLITQVLGGYCVTEWSQRGNSLSDLKKDAQNSQKDGTIQPQENGWLRKNHWSFPNLDWVVILTGYKVKTHEHLSQLCNLDWNAIEDLNRSVVKAFEAKNESAFVEGIRAWRGFLKNAGLEAATTTELVDELLETPGVKAAKGCGALGSDSIVIFFDKAASTFINGILEGWSPGCIIRSHQVSESGLKVVYENKQIRSL